MFVDSDDYLHPQAIEYCVTQMEQYGAQMVQFGMLRTTEDMPCDFQPIDVSQLMFRTGETCIAIESMSDHVACAKMYVTDLIRKLGLEFKYRIFEDTHFTRRYSLCIEKAVFTDYPLYYYFSNPTSLTSTMSAKKLQESICRADEVVQIYKEHRLDERANEYIGISKSFFLRNLLSAPQGDIITIPKGSIVGKEVKKAVELYNSGNSLLFLYCCTRIGWKFSLKQIVRTIRRKLTNVTKK